MVDGMATNETSLDERYRILVADDEDIARTVLATLLTNAGMDVVEVSDGEQALRISREGNIDLAILDYEMPGRNGREVAQALRELFVPFMLATIHTEDEVVQSMVKLGALGFLVKPIDSDKVVPSVLTALHRARDIRHLEDAALDSAQNKESADQTRTLIRKLVAIHEEERRRVASELHDELQQGLLAAKLSAQSMESALMEPMSRSGGRGEVLISQAILEQLLVECGSIVQRIDQINSSTRRIIAGLRPTLLDHVGLRAALDQLVRLWAHNHSGCSISTELSQVDDTLSNDLSLTVYRIVQESLTNIAKHSNATQVHIDISLVTIRNSPAATPGETRFVHVQITDNGKGFDTDMKKWSVGLLGMRERVRGHGGDLTIHSALGRGATLSAIMPIP